MNSSSNTNGTSHASPSAKKHPPTPAPPRWRFVPTAKKTHGYSTADAGKKVEGLSAEELAAKYRPPALGEREGGGAGVVGRLDIEEGGRGEVGAVEGEFAGFDPEEESAAAETSGRRSSHREHSQEEVSSSSSSRSSSESKDCASESNSSIDEMSRQSSIVQQEVSEEFVGEISLLSNSSAEDQPLSIPIRDNSEHSIPISHSLHSHEGNEESEMPLEQKTISFHSEENVTRNASLDKFPWEDTPSSETIETNTRLKRFKCSFPLLLLLACALALSLGLAFAASKRKRDDEIDADESNRNNLATIANSTALPSARPSDRPSSSAPSAAPSSKCPRNAKSFAVNVLQQNLSGWSREEMVAFDATWILREACSGKVVMECLPCADARGRIGENVFDGSFGGYGCLPSQKQYIFEVKASGGIGTCCGFFASKYTVAYDGDVLVEGETMKLDENSEMVSSLFDTTSTDLMEFAAYFGTQEEPCLTTVPSALPSVVDSETPSALPSALPSVVPTAIPSSIPSSEPTKEPIQQPSAALTTTMPTYQPTCTSTNRDFNLCFAIDMSGSVCNQGTGFECNSCEPSLICNADGIPRATCCNNFLDVVEFAKGMVIQLGNLASNQTYSVVQFATNATLVTSSTSSFRALDALDEMIYAGGLTNHAEAIAACQETLQSSSDGDVQNLILLVTDGNPSEPKSTSPELEAVQAADEAKASGTYIIPVMIARTLDADAWEYMREIGSVGSVFNVTDFRSLEMLQERLIAQVSCQT